MTPLVRLKAALKAAAEEHGVPNSFSPGWLAAYHGAPRPTHIGQLMSGRFRLDLDEYTATYAERNFHVSLK